MNNSKLPMCHAILISLNVSSYGSEAYTVVNKNIKDVNESRNARVSKKILVLENLISRQARNSRTHKAKLHD